MGGSGLKNGTQEHRSGSVVTWLKGRGSSKRRGKENQNKRTVSEEFTRTKKADTEQQTYTESRTNRKLDEKGNRIAVESSGKS